jgi:hypothetical protein
MIDPHNLPAGKMNSWYLEEWILFGILVANKPAVQTAEKLDAFLKDLRENVVVRVRDCNPPRNRLLSPFELIIRTQHMGVLPELLKKHRFGQYGRIGRAFKEVIDLPTMGKNPNLTLEMLESIHGIGMKTARMLMLYWKPDSQVVPLDTHVLKYLGKLGYDVPKNTPTGRRYLELEQAFIKEAKKRRMSVIQLDKKVWQAAAIR